MRRWSRTVLSSVFVLFMLASGHLLMVVVNSLEERFSAPQALDGVDARLLTDVPLLDEIRKVAEHARSAEERALLEQAAARIKAGDAHALRTLPVTRFLVGATILLVLLGCALLWWTVALKSDAAQTIVGVFAGNLLWTGGVEYGLTIAARLLGVAKTVAVVDGQVVAVFGEYVLLKHTWGALVLVMAYLQFLESSRCPLFLFFRERAPLMRGGLVAGRIDNYGPRTAFQYATIVWAFYLLLLWAYDETLFGVHGVFTLLVLVASIAGTVYSVWRLHAHKGWGPAIRYAIGAMIVAWTPLEILGKWGVFQEPWLLLEPLNVLVVFGGLGVGTWALWKAQRRKFSAALSNG